MRIQSGSLRTCYSFATLALFALSGCEDRAYLKFSQAQRADQIGDAGNDRGGDGGGGLAPGAPELLPPAAPGEPDAPNAPGAPSVPGAPTLLPPAKPSVDDIDRDIDDDDEYDHEDEGDTYCGKGRKSTFYRRIQVPGVDWEGKLSLAKGKAGADECKYDRSIQNPAVDRSKSGRVSLDKCSGFLKAREIHAKNGGACKAQEIKIRRKDAVGVKDYRYLALGSDCTCYYGRELKVGSLVEAVRKRFALPETCARNFEVWAKYGLAESSGSDAKVDLGLVNQ